MEFVTTTRGGRSLIQVIGTHSIEEQQMGRYIGDVHKEVILEEQSWMLVQLAAGGLSNKEKKVQKP